MTASKPDSQPTEKTPRGYEVPIPRRREFFSNLKKIAGKPPAPDRPKK